MTEGLVEGETIMKHPRCACGKLLQGRQKVQCAECLLKKHPGSSQCAHCFQWYMSHGGSSYIKERELHATGRCRRQRVS